MNMLVLRDPTPPEPLVLIPGFMADARSFMPQLARLGADRQVILLGPGLGDSVEKIVTEHAPHLPPRLPWWHMVSAATSRSRSCASAPVP
ncbi:MAG: alpha/beta fold hydrolase [Tabrizicola sp.]